MANLGAKETVWCFLEAEGLKRPEGVQGHQQREKSSSEGGKTGRVLKLRKLQPRAQVYGEQCSRGPLRGILKTRVLAS